MRSHAICSFRRRSQGWPVAWRVTDEFYNFRSRLRDDAAVIADLDESTYEGGEMGADHPISWCQRNLGGPSWYTGLGHRPELFGDAVFLAHLENGPSRCAGAGSALAKQN